MLVHKTSNSWLRQKIWSTIQDRNNVLILNGEIYNFLELKKELIDLGYFLTQGWYWGSCKSFDWMGIRWHKETWRNVVFLLV